MPVPSSWHPGEVEAQQARGFEDDVWGGWEGYQDGSPDWMTLFMSQLPFLSVTTLDDRHRPWCSLITFDGRTGFIQEVKGQENHLRCTIRAPEGVPIRTCLVRLHDKLAHGEEAIVNGEPKLEFCIGAVGVMLHNRRRNKMEGVIVDVESVPKQNDKEDVFVFVVRAFNTFGNCPKYINARIVAPTQSTDDADTEQKEVCTLTQEGSNEQGDRLPDEVLRLIAKTDLVFLASMYAGHDPASYMPDPPRLGNNHRGGPAGFLRTYYDEERKKHCVVLPDWSGNRLMMSFGNIMKNSVAGITVPVFSEDLYRPSSLIHLTCTAKVLANEEASALMRGVRGAVQLWIEDWTYVKNGFPVSIAKLDEGVGWSPYNPPVRLLKREQTGVVSAQGEGPSTRLIDARFWSDEIATFTFEVHGDDDQTLAKTYKFGKHVVADAYALLDTRVQLYTHMAQFRGGEKDLNDDGTRSWTVTHVDLTKTPWQFELTLRRKMRGGVTPSLFQQGRRVRESLEEGMEPPPAGRMKMNILGLDGDSTLALGSKAEIRLTYLLSGIGLTPILPHLAQILSASPTIEKAEVLAVVATRNNEAGVVQKVLHHALSRTPLSNVQVRFTLFLLVSDKPATREEGDFEEAAIDEELWHSLPSNVSADISLRKGERLADSSLSSDEQVLGTFQLPARHVPLVTQSDYVTVCAAPKFARLAQDALAKAKVDKQRIHMESFAF